MKKTKMKKVLFGLLSLILVGSLVLSFTSEAATPAPTATPTPSPAPTMPKRFIWASGDPKSAAYTQALGVSDMINRNSDLMITVNPYSQPLAYKRAVHIGEAHMCSCSQFEAWSLAHGVKSEAQPNIEEAWPDLRMLIGIYTLWWGFITRPDTGITSLADLKGHTLSWRVPGQLQSNIMGDGILRAAGIDPNKDVKHVTFSDSQDIRVALKTKKVDAILTSLTGAGIQELASTVGVVYLPASMELYAKLTPDIKRIMTPIQLPAKYLSVLDKPQVVFGWPSMLLCRADLNEQASYTIAKIIMEHGRELDKIGPGFKEVGVDQFSIPTHFTIPMLPGSIRYFKEVGKWTPAHERRQAEAVAEFKK